ncbi:class I SAM-dependent methyltransferase [Streptomyces anulatus]
MDSTQHALDLGCGPGTVALELAGTVNAVFAVDPAAGMLKQGQELAVERGIRNIRWQQGVSNALLSLGLPPLDLERVSLMG